MNLIAPVNFAKIIIERHRIVPPFDLEELVLIYSNLYKLSFPTHIDADGVVENLKGIGKPSIYLNSGKPETRQKFTLAHELGHVIIPWHVGNIISHTNVASSELKNYYQIETEANAFASELLFPSDWMAQTFKSYDNKSEWLNFMLKQSGASFDALMYRLKTFEQSIIIISKHFDDKIRVNSSHTAPKYYSSDINQTLEEIVDKFNSYEDIEHTHINGKECIILSFPNKLRRKGSTLKWRELLNKISDDLNLSKTKKQSINSITAYSYNKRKHLSLDDSAQLVYSSFDGREDMEDAMLHPLFPDYIYKRCEEMTNKQHSSAKKHRKKEKISGAEQS